jgi:hypothetical protein
MLSKSMAAALASAAMVWAGPALAQSHGGGGGHGNGAANASTHGGGGGAGNAGGAGLGGFGSGLDNIPVNNGTDMRDAARANSQGPAHASATGIAHANQNSVLAGTGSTNAVTSGNLAGLTTGMTLFSNGTAVGTVKQIRTTGNGSVAVVLVQGANGRLYPIPASKLALNGGALTTMARLNGLNGGVDHMDGSTQSQARLNSQGPAHASATGIAHANQHSVLAGATVGTPLTGVSSGMALMQNGTQVGTVQRVVTNGQGMIVRVLVTGTNGRTYSLSPSNLSLTGGTLSTAAPLRGI